MMGSQVEGYDTDGEPYDKEERIRRKLNMEDHVISGFDTPKQQQEVIFLFWEKIWPELETAGWTKFDGTGKEAGSIHFHPKGAEYYYNRVRGVIDRLLERRNAAESAIVEKHLAALESSFGKRIGPPRAVRPRRRAEATSIIRKESSGMIDESWKNGGRDYPKKASKVGPEYQATEIPNAGTYQDQEAGSEIYCELVWDPEKAKAKGISLDPEDEKLSRIPSNKKETALLVLAERDFHLEGFDEVVHQIKPIDGSDWSPEKRKRFHTEIFRLRKNLLAVSKSLEIDMKSCLTYYLGSFKKSDDYRLVKTVCEEKRDEKTDGADHGVDACAICDDGGSLLICDGCEGEYHIGCLRPPLEIIPEGHWECDKCVDLKFLAARDYLIRNTKLFKKKVNKKRTADEMGDMEDSEEDQQLQLEPTDSVLEAVRQLASSVSSALSKEHFGAASVQGNLSQQTL